jgi:hypothetical protein
MMAFRVPFSVFPCWYQRSRRQLEKGHYGRNLPIFLRSRTCPSPCLVLSSPLTSFAERPFPFEIGAFVRATPAFRGVESNRKVLDYFLDKHHAQGLSKRRVSVDELFHEATYESFKL